MIKGIGTDIIAIDRMNAVIARYGTRFLEKVYTPAEIELCGSKSGSAIHFAGRWAAKEAFYKALPYSCQLVSSWKSIQVLSNDRSRHPLIEICANKLKSSIIKENISSIHLSISHERSFCIAFVVMS